MYISPIRTKNYPINYNKKNNNPTIINFCGTSLNVKNIGRLDSKTSNKISNFLHAYNDIVSKLACKTEEGIKYITENFPVTIKDCIILHNCGDNNNSIAINLGGGEGVKSLMHIVRRKGNSTWSERIVEEAYMIENNSRLLSEFKTNYMKIFPQDRKYLSQDDIKSSQADTKIQNLLEDLEPVMLKFRIFLSKNMDKHLKAPDGKIPYSIIEEIKQIERLIDASREDVKKIPKKQLYKLLEEQHKEYVPLKGNSTYSFKNLGEERLTIAFAPVESNIHENLKRLVVYNEDGSLKRVFIMQGNKLVKNTSSTDFAYLADKFEFYDENEILSDNISGDFFKYLKLYQKSVAKLQAIVHDRAKSIEAKTVEGYLSESVGANLTSATENFNNIVSLYKNANAKDKKEIKDILSSKRIKLTSYGITAPMKDSFKSFYLQPVKNDLHSNLLKFAITDEAAETLDYYLIHNNEKIVKNFWANCPTIIPTKIKYLEEDLMPDLTKESKDVNDILIAIKKIITDLLNKNNEKRIQAKLEAKAKALEALEIKKILNDEKLSRGTQQSSNRVGRPKSDSLNARTDYKLLMSICKEQFNQALKNIDNGLEDFNKTMSEIQQKITEFYLQNKKS